MIGYLVKTGDGKAYYGMEDSYSEAKQLLKVCLEHDPNATIEKYEYESQGEKIYRLEQENAALKSERDELKKALKLACSKSEREECQICDQNCEFCSGINPDYYIQQAKEELKK